MIVIIHHNQCLRVVLDEKRSQLLLVKIHKPPHYAAVNPPYCLPLAHQSTVVTLFFSLKLFVRVYYLLVVCLRRLFSN